MTVKQSSFLKCLRVRNAFLAWQEAGFASLPLKGHSYSLWGQKHRKSKHVLQMNTLSLLKGLADGGGNVHQLLENK